MGFRFVFDFMGYFGVGLFGFTVWFSWVVYLCTCFVWGNLYISFLGWIMLVFDCLITSVWVLSAFVLFYLFDLQGVLSACDCWCLGCVKCLFCCVVTLFLIVLLVLVFLIACVWFACSFDLWLLFDLGFVVLCLVECVAGGLLCWGMFILLVICYLIVLLGDWYLLLIIVSRFVFCEVVCYRGLFYRLLMVLWVVSFLCNFLLLYIDLIDFVFYFVFEWCVVTLFVFGFGFEFPGFNFDFDFELIYCAGLR